MYIFVLDTIRGLDDTVLDDCVLVEYFKRVMTNVPFADGPSVALRILNKSAAS